MRKHLWLLAILIAATSMPLNAAGKKARKQPQWVVRHLEHWDISSPEGFGLKTVNSGPAYHDWSRTWEKVLVDTPSRRLIITYTERVYAVAGPTFNTECGGVTLPPRDRRPEAGDGFKVTPVTEGRHLGFPTLRFTVSSQAGVQGDRCMEHVYSVEPPGGGSPGRIEVSYTFSAVYPAGLVSESAVGDIGKGGPNYKTYLQMLATLKPGAR